MGNDYRQDYIEIDVRLAAGALLFVKVMVYYLLELVHGESKFFGNFLF